jgi:hypothetical protein
MILHWPSCLFLVSGLLDGQVRARLVPDQRSISWLTSSRLLLAGNSLLVLFVGCEHYRASVLPGLFLLFNATGMGFSFRCDLALALAVYLHICKLLCQSGTVRVRDRG